MSFPAAYMRQLLQQQGLFGGVPGAQEGASMPGAAIPPTHSFGGFMGPGGMQPMGQFSMQAQQLGQGQPLAPSSFLNAGAAGNPSTIRPPTASPPQTQMNPLQMPEQLRALLGRGIF